jgi:uncharacterized Zn-binding protein involved in type VI secretion
MAERPIIRVGDPTSHGGFVIEGFTNYLIDGRAAAGLGHLVTCPICAPGIHSIVEGSDLFVVDGIPISYGGALTSCGASLIATQHTNAIEFCAGSGIAFRPAMGSPAATGAVPSAASEGYDQHFHLHDEASGEPLANRRYRITIDSKTFEGVTDGNGKTKAVSAKSAIDARLEVLPEGQ